MMAENPTNRVRDRARRSPHLLAALLPAGLLLAFTLWCGTFRGAANGWAALIGHLILLLAAAAAGPAWRDPLRLGRGSGRFLVAVGCVLLLVFYQSPVPRAGRVAMLLIPAFLLIPSAVARWWSTPERRRLGLAAVAAGVTGVSGVALAGWIGAAPGAGTAEPLGHHNLLAAWLLACLPIAVLPWRHGGVGRVLAVLAAISGVGALALSGSRSGAVVAVAMLTAVALSQGRRWLGVLCLLVGVLVGAWIATDLDPAGDTSLAARASYAQAAWEGFLKRPGLGWGLGASSWTLHEHLRPVPGVHPAGQVVADPHSFPLRLLYEVGILGSLALLALGWRFARRRWRERGAATDPALAQGAALGLLALLAIGGAGRLAAAPALLVAAVLLLGAWLAAGPPSWPPREGPRSQAWTLALLLAVLLIPLDLAHLAYDRAVVEQVAGNRTGARAEMEQAVRLDPELPLYRMRLALLGEGTLTRAETLVAAQAARGIAPFWLLAGRVPEAPEGPLEERVEKLSEGDLRELQHALRRACALAPLDAMAPWLLSLTARAEDPRRVQWAARALLAEPRLLAATERPPRWVLRRAAARLGELTNLQRLWARELARLVREIPEPEGPLGRLVLEMDGDPSKALSLHAFRRAPWPLELAEVQLAGRSVERIEAALGPAPLEGELQAGRGCGLPD